MNEQLRWVICGGILLPDPILYGKHSVVEYTLILLRDVYFHKKRKLTESHASIIAAKCQLTFIINNRVSYAALVDR